MSEQNNSNMHQRTKEELRADGVTLLGSGKTEYPNTYNPGVLQSFENKHKDVDYVITFDITEGTSLCPVTKQPDFFKMVVTYIPNERCLESKSAKLYNFGWRETPSYHEDIVNTTMKDIRDLIQPKLIIVKGIFSVRGGIALLPVASYADPKYPEYVEMEKQIKVQTMCDAINRTIKYD